MLVVLTSTLILSERAPQTELSLLFIYVFICHSLISSSSTSPSGPECFSSNHLAIVISQTQHDPNFNFKLSTDAPTCCPHPPCVTFYFYYYVQVYYLIFQRYHQDPVNSDLSFLPCRLKSVCSDTCGDVFGYRFTSRSQF